MDDKERLEEIEKDIFINRKSDMTKLLHGDALWLIQQANRVEKLEKENAVISIQLRTAEIKSIEYKQALEFYANRTEWIEGDIYLDAGEKARQSLRGDSHDSV
ncbi:hypothetical protein ACFSMW_06735 [Virgibacillus halophilus]|uniref:hypothetical protein n=1 Tax=Tigheibacillus halophilus TaxID=361280 RepID=UPI00362F8A46